METNTIQTITMVERMAHTTVDKIVIVMEHIRVKTAMVTHGEEIQKKITTINLMMDLITPMSTTMLMVPTKVTATKMVMKQPTEEINKETTITKLQTTPTKLITMMMEATLLKIPMVTNMQKIQMAILEMTMLMEVTTI